MNKNHKKNGKSLAKSYGLKSILANENKLLVAVSGKKAETLLEQKIDNSTKEKEILIDPTKFDVSFPNERDLSLSTVDKVNTKVNNPYYLKKRNLSEKITSELNRNWKMHFSDKLLMTIFMSKLPISS